MKNITVSVNDEVYHRARLRAAERKTSVSAIVRGLLQELSEEKSEFDRMKELEAKALLQIRSKPFSASNRLGRDQLHDRNALR